MRKFLENTFFLLRLTAASSSDDSAVERRWLSNKVKAASGTYIQPSQQTLVRVTSHKHRFYIVEPGNDLLNKHGISVSSRIVEIKEKRPFYLLVAFLGRRTYFISRNMTVDHVMGAEDNFLLPSSLIIGVLLGVIPQNSDDAKIDGYNLLAADL